MFSTIFKLFHCVFKVCRSFFFRRCPKPRKNELPLVWLGGSSGTRGSVGRLNPSDHYEFVKFTCLWQLANFEQVLDHFLRKVTLCTPQGQERENFTSGSIMYANTHLERLSVALYGVFMPRSDNFHPFSRQKCIFRF